MINQDISQQTVAFWGEQHTANWGRIIPLILPQTRKATGRNWPRTGPGEAQLFQQLRQSRRAWAMVSQEGQVTLIVGPYSLRGSVNQGSGTPKLWLGNVNYATNADRARAFREGIQLAHAGIEILTPQEMGNLEKRDPFWASGQYAQDLRELIRTSCPLAGQAGQTADTQRQISELEADLVSGLESFIDAEFELEERLAQQTPGFLFTNLKALSRAQYRKQYYQVTVDEQDYERIREIKPSILAPADAMGLPDDLRFSVEDLEPESGKPKINLSLDTQTDHLRIPESGELLLAALPTLQRVRKNVLEQLAEGATTNPWLLPLLAGEYNFQPTNMAEVTLPESDYPPTPSQLKAIRKGAGTNDYALVLGPPGTGKTTVILSWVRHFVSQGKRVLVTSQNNKAVDNVLEKLAEDETCECIRIGNEAKISSTLAHITLDNKAAELQSKLFDKEGRALEYLERCQAYADKLRASASGIEALKQQIDARSKAEQSAQSQWSTVKTETRTLEQNIHRLSQHLHGLQNRLHKLQSPVAPAGLKPILKLLFRIPALITQTRLVVSGRKVTQQQKALSTALTREQTLNRQIQQLQGELSELRTRHQGFFRDRPDDLVAGLAIPGPETYSTQAVNALKTRLDELQADIEGWFNELRSARQEALYDLLFEHVNVVGATCIGINTQKRFRNMKFDVVIVDESGQIQAHNLIVPLSRAPKAILVGDHKQLPPVVQDEVLEEIESRGAGHLDHLYRNSWFEELWELTPDHKKVMLDTQFRCPAVISDFVSEAFYDNGYFAGKGMELKKPLFSFTPSPMVFVDTRTIPDRFESSVQQDGRNVVQDNKTETEVVVNLLEQALAEHPELSEKREIGVIVPYANHVKKIQQAIKKAQRQNRLKHLTTPLNELVASVDSFQGQERDLILFPFTRSNTRGSVGFLADWRRLNVAQTRAKRQLIMIGDSSTLTRPGNRQQAPDTEFKQAMKTLITRCEQRNAVLDAAEWRYRKSPGTTQPLQKKREPQS
ncbi:DEAD/DEAH box helicase [Marinobacter sp.]|uniref:DEAD/DEAH box helicase n=1 Tax=Marinobacter sp. TaxID=50741 RepID=UPI0035624A74